jgi:hypothetical protein
MTASTETGIGEFNDEVAGNLSQAAATVPTSNPPEPEQQGTVTKTGTFDPRDSGIPQSHIVTETEG